ncbi:MAG: hypothetical protein GWP10_19935 [Nitrospiraceae bacterium]|nr:hypothetical protein [Nitrospiraceae bacterium]
MDVNGDGSVTSLDVLMSLRAAAGSDGDQLGLSITVMLTIIVWDDVLHLVGLRYRC